VPAGDVVTKLRAEGLLALTAGENVLRILPPLVVTDAEIDTGVEIMHKVAREWPQ
jgi:4-aminobutyrate aminotransferase-like enzyme